MQKILIIGATSAIAQATARRFAGRGDRLYLLGRDFDRLEALAQDLRIRGAESVDYANFEAENFAGHPALLDQAYETLGGIDVALIAHGTLPDQRACEQSFDEALRELNVNAIGTLSLLTHLANRMEQQGNGTLAVVSSPAGDRGRQSNYVYGAAKAMVTVFCQGLRNRLFGSGVRVLTIKPGFVDTPMTAAFEKGMLWAQPERIAAGIEKAIGKGADSVYLPGFWALIMLMIRSIPETVFKRLKL
ncbi:decaprenylphospho-beta-D-erythro-pentofuranosid-2-ulose 2-reductase [Methylococcus capsulatus]|uniref:Decaprenylphospho-beta-D-erythro-pentofuranosid-2-ulose 2-reductase n=1 Tax=Methylococcus capsulatus TaxID=414 RepID=A0AA35V4L4_METCP|nr:SDR family oxidoreductase [Methylococcus capsulatus]CAI8824953.1 decaprenylphospho-beta-D-erythro-pentofuranosid-2-ulose 2-reductase [Methylococcus capsulatus]